MQVNVLALCGELSFLLIGLETQEALQRRTLLTWMSTHLTVRYFLHCNCRRSGVLFLPLVKPEHRDHRFNSHMEQKILISVRKGGNTRYPTAAEEMFLSAPGSASWRALYQHLLYPVWMMELFKSQKPEM